MRRLVRNIPVLGPALARSYWRFRTYRHAQRARHAFSNSGQYWTARYASGGSSGDGSYGTLAKFKAEFLNDLIRDCSVDSVIEFGCGDGNQLSLAVYPRYLGFDVSDVALERCRRLFASDGQKQFKRMDQYCGEVADLTLSLDVIYHLIEDDTYAAYMRRLFGSSRRLVVIYSSNFDDHSGFYGPHVRHRLFTAWVEEHAAEWACVRHVPNRYPYQPDTGNGSLAHFFVYQRVASAFAGDGATRRQDA